MFSAKFWVSIYIEGFVRVMLRTVHQGASNKKERKKAEGSANVISHPSCRKFIGFLRCFFFLFLKSVSMNSGPSFWKSSTTECRSGLQSAALAPTPNRSTAFRVIMDTLKLSFGVVLII